MRQRLVGADHRENDTYAPLALPALRVPAAVTNRAKPLPLVPKLAAGGVNAAERQQSPRQPAPARHEHRQL